LANDKKAMDDDVDAVLSSLVELWQLSRKQQAKLMDLWGEQEDNGFKLDVVEEMK